MSSLEDTGFPLVTDSVLKGFDRESGMCLFHIKGRKMAHLLNCRHAGLEPGFFFFYAGGGEAFKNIFTPSSIV